MRGLLSYDVSRGSRIWTPDSCDKILKVERNKFRFTGLDVEKIKGDISVGTEDYTEAIKLIPVFRSDDKSSLLE